MRTLSQCCAILVCLLSAGAVSAGVVLPEYDGDQLQDKQFVRDEIVRMSSLRDELLKQHENATVLVQMTVKKDVQKVDSALEALRYVESAGFRKDDPELAKLRYFQSSSKPFESGFRHNMTPAGPRGGRVSILEKPLSRTTKTPAQRKEPKSTLPPRRSRRTL